MAKLIPLVSSRLFVCWASLESHGRKKCLQSCILRRDAENKDKAVFLSVRCGLSYGAPPFFFLNFTLRLKYPEPNCAYVISVSCLYCRKNKLCIRGTSSVADNAVSYSSSWDQAKGIITFIYVMCVSEICHSHFYAIQTLVILWLLISSMIRNLIKYPLIFPFSMLISSGAALDSPSPTSYSLVLEVKHGCFSHPLKSIR